VSWAGLDDGDAKKEDGSSYTLTLIHANNIARQCQKTDCRFTAHGILVRKPVQPETIQSDTVRSTARSYKYLDALTTAFVVILLVSNLLAQKVCLLGPFAVSGAVLLFPITYIFGDVFTEVYGYAASRRAIWLGFFGTALLYVVGAIVIVLPSAPDWPNQQAFATVFGFIPRILAASLIAFWAGEFANSYTMARLKLFTDGRKLWTRTIGSTVVGQAVDTVLVIALTFGGIYPVRTLLNIMATGYALKVGYEVIATPLTYLIINWLKRTEHSDAFDRHQNFNPFAFAEKGTPDA
jgi:queuosine precursor transporter